MPAQARGVTGWQSSVAGGVRASQQAEAGHTSALRVVTARGEGSLAAAEQLTLSSEGVFALMQVRAEQHHLSGSQRRKKVANRDFRDFG
jgi:hypothetical protein